jgi:hypothetical protein
MGKIFQYKYIVRVLAFAALALALFVIASPKIEQYNQSVQKEQIELRKQADGIVRLSVFSFSGGEDYRLKTAYPFLIMCFSLFISLLLTKRIIFSFLSAFLYSSQFIILYRLIWEDIFENAELPIRNNLISFIYNASGYQLFLINCIYIACLLALSFWQSSVICRFSRCVSLGFKTKL